jgi:Protein of unknown function (DUF1573)
MRKLFFILMILSFVGLNAQSFHSTKENFNKISAVYKPPVTFYYTNSTYDPMVILRIDCDEELIVFYKKKFIQHKEVSTIIVYYSGNKLGNFKHKIKIFTNINDEPIILKVKGKMIKIQDCSKKTRTFKFWLRFSKVDIKNDTNPKGKKLDSTYPL